MSIPSEFLIYEPETVKLSVFPFDPEQAVNAMDAVDKTISGFFKVS